MPLSSGKNKHLAQNYRFFYNIKSGNEISFRDEGCLDDGTPSQTRAHLLRKLMMSFNDPETGKKLPMFAAKSVADMGELTIKTKDRRGKVHIEIIPGLLDEDDERVQILHRIACERIPIKGKDKAWEACCKRNMALRQEAHDEAVARVASGSYGGIGAIKASELQASFSEQGKKVDAGALRAGASND